MTEEEFGKAWAAMAKAEGHVQGIPPTMRPGHLFAYRKRHHLKRQDVIDLLMQGHTIASAADALRMNRSTLGSWMREQRIFMRDIIKARLEAAE